MNQVLNYLLERLKEKSTWVGLGSVLTGMGVTIAPDKWQAIMAIGMGIPGLISVFLPARVQEKNVAPTSAPTALSDSMQQKGTGNG